MHIVTESRGLNAESYNDNHIALCVPLATEADVPLPFQPRRETGLSRAFGLLEE